MKKLLALSLAVSFFPALAVAVGNRPMAGCGLGYLLFSNKDNSKATQIIGATTNGTFGSQTFGITSGTSGCTEDGAVKSAKEIEAYAEVNLANLRREMAAGEGQYVDGFARLLGAADTTRPQLVKFFQDNYAALFPTAETSSTEMLQVLTERLAQEPALIG